MVPKLTAQQGKLLRSIVGGTLPLSEWANKTGPLRTLTNLEKLGLIAWAYQRPVATEAGRKALPSHAH